MSKISVSVRHTLTQAEALERIKDLLKETRKEYGSLVSDLKESWKGNTSTFSFKARGYAIQGSMTVSAPTVELEGEIPWALGFLKGKIEKRIVQKAKELLK